MLAQYGVLMANNNPSLTALQYMAVAWHEQRFPGAGLYEVVSKKATEELGEVAQALNGWYESRTDRGDAAQEAAQLVVVLLILTGRYLDTDLYPLVHAEIERLRAAE